MDNSNNKRDVKSQTASKGKKVQPPVKKGAQPPPKTAKGKPASVNPNPVVQPTPVKEGRPTGNKRREDRRLSKIRDSGARLSDLPPFGNINYSDMEDTTSDDTLNISAVFKPDNLKSAIEGIISAGLTLGGDSVQQVNHAYVAKFLWQYIINEIRGNYQNYELKFAPVVFWDILHACTSRRSNGYAYKVTDFASPAWIDSTTANDGRPFGLMSSTDTAGYITVDVTTGSYTDALGYAAVVSFFGELGKKLNCRDNSYREIRSDDPSAFSYTQQVAANDPTSLSTWKCNANAQYAEREMRCLTPIQCKWIAGLGIFTAAACNVGRHHHNVYTSPGSIVAFRILRKYAGYQSHSEIPFIKPVPLSEVFLFIWRMSLRGAQTGYTGVDATHNPWFVNGITFNEWKMVNYIAIVRHFSRNSGIAVNMLHEATPLYFAASGNNPIHGCGGIMIPQCVEQNMASLYEYQVGNIWFYPMLWYDADIATAALNVSGTTWFATGGLLTDVWNWLTDKLTTSGLEVSGCYSDISGVMAKYNLSINSLQAYLPFAPMMYTPQFNAGQLTAIYANGNKHLVCVTSPRRIAEDIRKHLDMMLLPLFTVVWAGTGNDDDGAQRMAAIQHLLGEKFSISGDKGELQQVISVVNLNAQSIHVIGGGGTDAARVDEEEYEFELRDTKKKPTGRGSPTLSDVVARGIRDQAIRYATGALLGV